MNRTQRWNRGYSLAEMLVVVAIFAVFIIAALLIYDRQNRTFKQGVEAADMQQATRAAFDKLVSDVRMTGFDYDRDGAPQDGQQQPDEQIEYAGRAAMTIRGNFNYFTATAPCTSGVTPCDNGRETDYEPANGAFPVVTTSNKEIITYALKSANAAANTSSISFYADVAIPRKAYSGTGSQAETHVTIDGIDTTNNNPPYTLYKFTLQDDGTPDAGTPVADNIRRMEFTYWADQAGTTFPTRAGTTITNGTVGGDGQYDPANVGGTTNFIDRDVRTSIRAVTVNLIGMSSAPDPGYTNPTEPLAAFRGYRTYQLQTLITPRNLGLSGTSEPTLGAPGPPEINAICNGHCGAVLVNWTAPISGSPVETYSICYDTDSAGTFSDCIDIPAGATTSALPNLVAPNTYYLKVWAINDEGRTASTVHSVTVINRTKPTAPNPMTASIDLAQTTLQWTRPLLNDPSANTLQCTGAGGSTDATDIPTYESLHYRIYRGVAEDFNPTDTNVTTTVVDEANQGTLVAAGSEIAWVDNDASKKNTSTYPAAACKDYWYRIQSYDLCALDAAKNDPADTATGTSTINPVASSPAINGRFTSTQTPGRSLLLSVAAASSCNPGLNTCTIVLQWPPLLAASDTTPLASDTYNIVRYSRLPSDPTPVSSPITAITPQVTNALEYARTHGGLVQFTDSTALEHDPANNTHKYIWYYTITATSCGHTGAESNQVQYPSCPFTGSTVTTSDALTGNGSAADPWVLNGPDVLTVTPGTLPATPAGQTIDHVEFMLTDLSGNLVQAVNDTTSPYTLQWANREDGETYQLNATVVTSAGCRDAIDPKYITDQTPASCTLSPGTVAVSTRTESGSDAFQNVTVTFTDASPYENATPAEVTYTWSVPAVSGGRTVELQNIVWDGSRTSSINASLTSTDTLAATATVTHAVPSGTPQIPRGGVTNYSLQFQFRYRKQDANLTSAILPKICISYTLASEPGVTKRCNVVPGINAGATPNPDTCQ